MLDVVYLENIVCDQMHAFHMHLSGNGRVKIDGQEDEVTFKSGSEEGGAVASSKNPANKIENGTQSSTVSNGTWLHVSCRLCLYHRACEMTCTCLFKCCAYIIIHRTHPISSDVYF